MRIVLLSGGSGKRLWPLSNSIRSKIFLKLLPSEDGGKESMIQRVCRQLDDAGLLPCTSIAAHRSQAEIMQNHVGGRILYHAEPERRGTFAAAALAASDLHAKGLAAADETICVLPVDLFVEPAFYRMLRQFPSVLAQSGADLALLGTKPKHPSSQFGYIVPRPTDGSEPSSQAYRDVEQFVEKPEEALALRLIERQALWNCGVFAFKLSFLRAHMERAGLPFDYEQLIRRYGQLPDVSFDVAIAENAQRRVMLAYGRDWRDLGDWNTLPDYMGSRIVGPGYLSSDSDHTHIVNELACPIRVIGLSNTIVAASPDGILVADKSQSNRIKQLLQDELPTRYGEKRWGSCLVLDESPAGGSDAGGTDGMPDGRPEAETYTLTKKVDLLPGRNTSYHLHRRRREISIVLSGTGEFILESAHRHIQAGDVLQIPAGAKHAVKAVTPLTFIEIQFGTPAAEEDIERFAMTWADILQA